MATSLFWKLPAELREQIYLDAFAPDEASEQYTSNNRLDLRIIGDIAILTPSISRRWRQRGRHAVGLLPTCRAIYHEALPALYASLHFTLRLGGPPSHFFYHDVMKDINLGLVGRCLLLRNARHFNISVELKSIESLDYLVEHQLPRLIPALRDAKQLDIRHSYVAMFLPVPEERDHEVLEALKPLVGEGFGRTGMKREATRRYCKTVI